MAEELQVFGDALELGTLRKDRGEWELFYADTWLTSSAPFGLSPHLPLQTKPHHDIPETRTVFWFFDNLLPEGRVRDAYARHAKVSPSDTFGLLRHYGWEGAGALTMVSDSENPPASTGYTRLPNEDLMQLIENMPEVLFGTAGNRTKMSLAGAQHKLALHRDEDGFLLPQGGPSTWLAKPKNSLTLDYPHTPANEHFCMTLARTMGLEVPPVELTHLPEPLYLIQRYDRLETAPNDIRRRHQVDLCQLLNKWPSFKYESGGATLKDVFGSANRTVQPAQTKHRLLKWVVFNYLIGNSDAHAKNLSFMVSASGITLAPHYDLLCVKVYGDDDMAMSIAEQTRYGWVEREHWTELGDTAEIRSRLVLKTASEMARNIPSAARTALAWPGYTTEERGFLEQVVEVIDEHAGYVLEAIGS